MAYVLSNIKVASDCYILTVEGQYEGSMGQFYMIRAWDRDPLLPRPFSIYDIHDHAISFLYRVVGEGTRHMARLKQGDQVEMNGPLGNGFPHIEGHVALVGGGLGIAPLYLAAKQLTRSTAYLGFSREAFAEEPFREVCDEVFTQIGGSIIDQIDQGKLTEFDAVFACGPSAMLQALEDRMKDSDIRLYVSIENRMACGIGACLVCSCPTKRGNRRVCVEGPVFQAEEVLWDE